MQVFGVLSQIGFTSEDSGANIALKTAHGADSVRAGHVILKVGFLLESFVTQLAIVRFIVSNTVNSGLVHAQSASLLEYLLANVTRKRR